MDKRLNDHGKYWRHVYKTLVLLEYMICSGSDLVVNYAQERIHSIGTLREFVHIDDSGVDQGVKIRAKSKDIVDLLSDEATLTQARAQRSIPNLNRPEVMPLTIDQNGQPAVRRAPSQSSTSMGNISRRPSYDELQSLNEEDALALAMQESKELYEKEETKRKNLQRAKSVESSAAFPSFLDNVNKATLAKSADLAATQINPNTEAAKPPIHSIDNLLNLDDEEFSKALDDTLPAGRTNRSQSLPFHSPQSPPNGLMSIDFGHGAQRNHSTSQAMENPFSELNNAKAGSFEMIADPFADLQKPAPPAYAEPREFVPMPLAPGMAPTNHLSVANNNIGAKPVAPFQMAPQFSAPQAGTESNSADKDPFNLS